MNIFLSWSGDKSKNAAILFKDWLPTVIQKAVPFISTEIDRGAAWFTEIQTSLSDCNQGIIFVTRDNQVKPWLQFEAGAISKGIGSNRVYTYLVDLSVSDIESGSPLIQINHTAATKDQTYKLIETINRQMGSEALSDPVLSRTFERMWPDLDEGLKKIGTEQSADNVTQRPQNEVLNDILENVLLLNQRISTPEARVSGKYLNSRQLSLVIDRLLDYQLTPGAINETLQGLAPSGYIRQLVTERLSPKPISILDQFLNGTEDN